MPKVAVGVKFRGRGTYHALGHSLDTPRGSDSSDTASTGILQLTWNTAPVRDRLQCWMLRAMDHACLDIVCGSVNGFMQGEHLEALSHSDLHLLPKKPPHNIGANRPLTNLVLLRQVVGLVSKEEEQRWLRRHNSLPPSRSALWPDTSVWAFLRVMPDYFWHQWVFGKEAWPVLDDVGRAFVSLDHTCRDSVHPIVAYDVAVRRLHRSLVGDMRLDMGGTDDIDNAIGWFDAGFS